MEMETRTPKYTKCKKIDHLFNTKKEIGNEGCWSLSSAK